MELFWCSFIKVSLYHNTSTRWPHVGVSCLLLRRYDSNSGGEREIQRTMLELLNQLDGFDSRGDVKVIMATNRIETLDPALIRPGQSQCGPVAQWPLPWLCLIPEPNIKKNTNSTVKGTCNNKMFNVCFIQGESTGRSSSPCQMRRPRGESSRFTRAA